MPPDAPLFTAALARYRANRDAGLLGPAERAALVRRAHAARVASLRAGDRDPALWSAYLAAADERWRAEGPAEGRKG